MEKLLTGKMVHKAYEHIRSYAQKWETIPQAGQERYNEMAKLLNQQLGLCEGCGERPRVGVLHEVAGDLLCTKCVTPPTEAHPELMYVYTYDDGTLAGVMIPPTGMSIEEYQKQLAEEMQHISFMLRYKGPEDIEEVRAKTLPDLIDLINTRIGHPSDNLGNPYRIYVFKNEEQVGFGSYKRMGAETQVIDESGAAEGLSEAIYAYVFNHV